MIPTRRRPSIRWAILAMSLLTSTARADGPRVITGRVVDADGKPVAGATVDGFWRANGPNRDPEGKPFDLSRPEVLRAFWGNLGVMEGIHEYPAVRTGPDGRFSVPDPSPHYVLMAQDAERQRGGLATVPKPGDATPVEIRLAPLTTVRGTLSGPAPGQVPTWTHISIEVPEDPTRPVDSNRLVSCGSLEARFVVKLPPGRYEIRGYSSFADPKKEGFEGMTIPTVPITVEPGQATLDLGCLKLSPYPPDHFRERKAEAIAAKRWRDHTEHYGEAPPRWHATDARGVGKDDTLDKFRGKWVLMYFWGLSCRPCITQTLPALTRFYDEHAAERDRFEVVSVFLDPDGKIQTMADFDRAVAPLVEHVWGGKSLPFPTLVEPTFETWERFGLSGLGVEILIDPDGRMVPGDLKTLAEKLKEPARSAR